MAASGHCGPNTPTFSDLVTGTYTLDETTVPSGYTKPASLPDTFDLVSGNIVMPGRYYRKQGVEERWSRVVGPDGSVISEKIGP